MKGLLPKFGFALVAILIVSAILISLGQRESKAKPSANSYNPSGLHAFMELLHKNGIRTRVDRLQKPRLDSKDLVIAAYIEAGPSAFGSSPIKDIEQALEGHIAKGGRVLVLPFEEDFRARSFTAVKAATPIRSWSGDETLQVSSAPLTFGTSPQFLPTGYADYWAWTKKDESPFVVMEQMGDGILARASDGLFATNRFLDRADNAQLALRLVKGLLPEGGRVVFTEASLGDGIVPTLASTLGPWAVGIWMQLTVLFLVVIFTLGIRFGLPAVERRKQAGQREMIDAIADVYVRAKSTAVALDIAYQEADYRIRRGLKLPAHVSIQERDRLIPESLAALLARIDQMRKPQVEVDAKGRQKVYYSLNPNEALSLIQKLDAQLQEFVPKTKNRLS